MRHRESTYLPEDGKFVAGEWVTDCPKCGGKKLYWNPNNQLGHCFNCKLAVHGEYQYKRLFEGLSFEYSPLVVTQSTPTIPHVIRQVSHTLGAWDFPISRKFLSGPFNENCRDLTEAQVRSAPIGGDGSKIWVRLDPITTDYKPVTFERPANGGGCWMPPRAGINKSAYVFGLTHWLARNWGSVILVEGVFDILHADLLGVGLALMGSNFSDYISEYLYRHNITQAYYIPDNDSAGWAGAGKASQKLRGWDIRCKTIPMPVDPKKMPPDAVRRIFAQEGVTW